MNIFFEKISKFGTFCYCGNEQALTPSDLYVKTTKTCYKTFHNLKRLQENFGL